MLQFPPGTCSSLFCFLVPQGSLLCFRRLPWQHILQDILLLPLVHEAAILLFLACISSSETLISSFSSGMLMLMISPSSTSAIGPPTAASGDTCPMDAPLDAPLKRPSVIRAMLFPRFLITADCLRCIKHFRHSASFWSFITDKDSITFLNFYV